MTELKPCPFCGVEPLTHDDFGIVFAQCSDEMCIANHGEFCGVESKAWNTRHIPEGYALVPIEPTDAMIRATVKVGDADLIGGNVSAERMSAWYKAMIEAAQESNE